MTSYYSTQATFYTFTVFTAIISAFLSFLASLLNYFYSLNKSSQYHLLVTLLILCDGFGSLCFAVWAGIDTFVQHHHDNYLCNIFLPFPTYFFLLSFCWTSLLAYRFRQICEVKDTKQAIDPPLWPVPVLCFFLILPIILMTTLGIKISEPISPISSKGLAFCFFASTRNAFIVNFLTFQFPCILTLLYNIRCFRIGIKFLRLSPERVMEREIKRARNYLIVLLVIWVPNLTVNLYHFVFLPPDKDPYIPVQALVLLTSLQGFINFLVYLWGYKPFQQWVSSFQFFHLPHDDNSERGSLLNVILSTTSDDGNDDNDLEMDPEKAEKEPLRKSILSTSPQKDSTVSGSRARIASGEKAVRFEERHECRYYDFEDDIPSSETNAFMPKAGYYSDSTSATTTI